jgi:hypothetical protein
MLSGVLDAAVLDAFATFEVIECTEDDGWLCFSLRSPEG